MQSLNIVCVTKKQNLNLLFAHCLADNKKCIQAVFSYYLKAFSFLRIGGFHIQNFKIHSLFLHPHFLSFPYSNIHSHTQSPLSLMSHKKNPGIIYQLPFIFLKTCQKETASSFSFAIAIYIALHSIGGSKICNDQERVSKYSHCHS